MKWDSKSSLSVYEFNIDIEALLTPVYYLVLDVVKSRYADRQFNEWAGDVFNIKVVTGQEIIDEKISKDLFLIEISHYLQEQLYTHLEELKKSEIRLLYRPKKILIAPSMSQLSRILISWIKNTGLMNMFLDLVKCDFIINIRETLAQFLNDQYFGEAVKVQKIETLKATFIQKNALKDCVFQPIDPESIWVNEQWGSRLGVKKETEYGEVLFPDIDDSCLMVGNSLVPLTGIDAFVKEEYQQYYFWEMLKDIYVSRKKCVSKYREQSATFKAAMKTSGFAQLMTKLKYNLYIKKDAQDIPNEYRQYFEEVYNIEEFIEKNSQILFTGIHLEEQFHNKQTMLGIYNTEKDGKDYNLQAWVNVESVGRQKKTAADGVKDISISTVYALKPQYSYYFSSTYFEDVFFEILNELGLEALHDVELSLCGNSSSPYLEVDNFVKKGDGTIVFIENKTTLNRYNIEDTMDKIARFHQVMMSGYPLVNIEYLLVALYVNGTVEEAYSYFTNQEGCSQKDFFLPMARFSGVRLHCIIEPEYENMKHIMADLLR